MLRRQPMSSSILSTMAETSADEDLQQWEMDDQRMPEFIPFRNF